MLGGVPGTSTLALQPAARLAENGCVFYATAEETLEELRDRAERLRAVLTKLYVIAEHNLSRIFRSTEALRPTVLVVDSLQMITLRASEAPGSPTTIREVAAEFVRRAQRTGTGAGSEPGA
jgi:DNA repair protein RadA/Sms